MSHLPAKLLKGLYFILNVGKGGFREVPMWLEGVMANGARIIQVRGKGIHPSKLASIAADVVEIAARYNALVIINDHPDIAAKAHAHGVHLGAKDASIAEAKAELSGKGIVGVTVRNPRQAAKAFDAGADYVAVGSIFKSPTKPDVKIVGLETAEAVKLKFPDSPVCAIGGINEENIIDVLKTGVDMYAVISAIASAENPEKAAFSLSCAFARQQILMTRGRIEDCELTEEMKNELDD
jgi:thiamine-phosphate diphosphorylase